MQCDTANWGQGYLPGEGLPDLAHPLSAGSTGSHGFDPAEGFWEAAGGSSAHAKLLNQTLGLLYPPRAILTYTRVQGASLHQLAAGYAAEPPVDLGGKVPCSGPTPRSHAKIWGWDLAQTFSESLGGPPTQPLVSDVPS